MHMMRSILILFLVVSLSLCNQLYFTPCTQDGGRQCPSDTNRTDFLLSMKKGGTNILSTNTYLYDFFLCQQYNYDCGYMEQKNDYVTIADGVSLNINQTQLTTLTTQPTTYDLIHPYIGLHGDSAKCGMSIFPLQLTPIQSKQVLDCYMDNLATKITTYYNLDRNVNTTTIWSSLNINIRTAILSKFKANATMIRNSTLWTKVVNNQWIECSKQLKGYYQQNNQQIDLHAAYLIDSVTQKCNKLQSINFLVDQSGSIGAPGFQLALTFLKQYVDITNDDITKMSINFYDTTYESYLGYGNTKSYVLSQIPIKPYRAKGTYTGGAINASVNLIQSANFPKGLPKILAILTDGASYDSVLQAADWARSKGIVLISVGIGSGINDTQLLQIAQTSSNYIKLSSYADLGKLVQFISNYFCKQIYTIALNQTIQGNFIRVPQSPSYFRVIKSPLAQGQYYQLNVKFQSDPRTKNFEVVQSQIDPFPDQYTQYPDGQRYDVFDANLIAFGLRSQNNDNQQNKKLGAGFVPFSVFFIQPQHSVNYIVKRQISNSMNVSVSYIAVRGTNLGFNISLKVCTTRTCVQQRNYYKSIFNKKQNDPVAPVIMIPEQQDLSIFIIIGSTLAALACLCLILIFACRKVNQEEQKKKGKKLNLNQTMQTQQNVDQNLVPSVSGKKLSNSVNVESMSDEK